MSCVALYCLLPILKYCFFKKKGFAKLGYRLHKYEVLDIVIINSQVLISNLKVSSTLLHQMFQLSQISQSQCLSQISVISSTPDMGLGYQRPGLSRLLYELLWEETGMKMNSRFFWKLGRNISIPVKIGKSNYLQSDSIFCEALT